MAIKYSVTKQPVMKQGNLIASNYGAHMFSVVSSSDLPNGYVAKIDTMTALDTFSLTTAGTIKAEVVLKGVDDTYLVLIKETDPMNVIVCQEPLIAEESPRELAMEDNFYNDPLDGAARAYQLYPGDRFWLNKAAFSGTPTVGASITTVTAGKLTI